MKKSILLLIFLVGFVLVGCNNDGKDIDKPDPKLSVTPTEMTLEVGEEQKITATLKDASEDAVVKYNSSDNTIAEVSSDGTVTAKNSGSTTINVTVEGHSDLKSTVNVTVNIDLTDQLAVTGPTEVVAGQKIQLEATDKADTGFGVIWRSNTPDIASVSSTGEVTGLKEGTALIEVISATNAASFVYEVSVLMAPVESLTITSNIQGEELATTVNLKLTAKVLPVAAEQGVIWETSDDSIATIDENGKVEINSYGTVTFTAKSIQNDDVLDEITVEFFWEVMDLIDYVVVPNPVIQKDVTAVGYQFNYNVDVLGSVSNYYFGQYEQHERIAPLTNGNRPGTKMTSIEFVTVHDTASTAASASASMHANYVYGGGGGTSWHYSIGNDGVWYQIPEDEVAYHAGDGSRTFKLNDTGVKAISKIKPELTIDSAGFYNLDGVVTIIEAPRKPDGSIAKTSEINDYGIYMEIGENGNWWMNNSWWSAGGYNRIGNGGGNRNSVGIETMVNEGSDLYLTWHYTAKKASQIALSHGLGLNRIVTHHFFSGKNCPQTMRQNNLFANYEKMVEAEYLVNKFLDGYTISFISNNTDLVDNTGRILRIPDVDTEVSYLVTVENATTGFSETRLYSSIVPTK